MTEAILINLDRSPERLARMTRQLESIGLPFRRLVACDGAKLDLSERQRWSSSRSWLDGQIGAFISHSRAWQMIAESSSHYGLVLEDDIHLSKDFCSVLNSFSWIPPEADIVRLETTLQGMRLGRAAFVANTGRTISDLRSEAWGMGAYMLRRDTANWLTSAPPRNYLPVDYFLYSKKHSLVARSLKVFQLAPAVAIQDKYLGDPSSRHNIPSLIEENPQQERGKLNQTIRGLGRRIVGRRVVQFV